MNGSTALRANPDELILTILTGEDKGVAYKLLGDKIALGRSSDNHVVLKDTKASRNHARIEKRKDGHWVVDLDSRVGVQVNGKSVHEFMLKDGDLIRIGDTTLRFGSAQGLAISQSPPFPGPKPQSSVPQPLPQMAPSIGAPPMPGALTAPPPMEERKNPFIVIIVLGLVVAIGLMTQKQVAKIRRMKIRDDAAFDQQIEGTDETNEQERMAIINKGKDTQQYEEAQGFYLRGFREFGVENYGRAIQDFEAALALYPDHALAKRYLERARLKNNELITSALERGEKDFQTQRYMAAFNEYRTVLLLTNDAKNKNYQLAEKRIETIQLILTNNR
jgi:hypothetical protein